MVAIRPKAASMEAPLASRAFSYIRFSSKKQQIVPYFIASHPGSDLSEMIDLALYLKQNGYRPDQVLDFIPAPFDIATCMYYTGLDPFTMKPVESAKNVRDRKMQRALMQFFKPENYFEVREALMQTNRPDRRLRRPHPGSTAEGGNRGAEAASERLGPQRSLPFRGEPRRRGTCWRTTRSAASEEPRISAGTEDPPETSGEQAKGEFRCDQPVHLAH